MAADPASETLIDVRAVSMRFPGSDVLVLSDVSLQVRRGELVGMIGPSGCGKSTLLNLICGLSSPSAGTIELTAPRARVAYVFQSPRLLPWRTVLGNVEFGLHQRRGSNTHIRERALEALRLVHLDGHEKKYPHQLSGGMQQRAALARGLALDPAICLLDEPFGALDALTRGYLQEELLGIVRQMEMTTVMVTHDIDEVLLLADRILVMSTRPGRIRAELSVPFGADRDPDTLMGRPEYAALRTRLREMLRPEVDVEIAA